ncbi:LysO family transporter, partial [Erysipelotrichaceae bacterium HCN-30851]
MVFLTILALILGILYGQSGIDISFLSVISSHSDFILYILMFSVGISIGLHEGLLAKLRQYHVKVLIIPFGIIIASVLGGVICGLIIHYPINISTAITSGLGWYSLAGATLGKLAGAEIGSIAFL